MTKRYQINMSDAGVKRIEELKMLSDIPSDKGLFDEALTIFDWAIEQVAAGRIITSMDVDKDTYRELQMPSFRKVPREDQGDNQEHHSLSSQRTATV